MSVIIIKTRYWFTSLRQVIFQQEIVTVQNEDALIKESSTCLVLKVLLSDSSCHIYAVLRHQHAHSRSSHKRLSHNTVRFTLQHNEFLQTPDTGHIFALLSFALKSAAFFLESESSFKRTKMITKDHICCMHRETLMICCVTFLYVLKG